MGGVDGGDNPNVSQLGDGLMAKKAKRKQFRASIDAVPPGAARPSMTMWYDPGGMRPPVSWWPSSGEFQTHWDSQAWSAFAVPGYWRGRLLLSQAIGGMPLAGWKGLEQLTPTPLVLREPAAGEDRCTTVAAWVGDLIDHGNAIGFVAARNAEGRATSLLPVPCTEVGVGYDAGGRVAYDHYQDGIVTRRYYPDAGDVFHAKGVLAYPGALRGMGALEAGLSSLSRIRDESAYASNAFRNGTPSGLLRVKDPDLQPGNPDDEAGFASAVGIKKQWKASIGTGDVAVLSDLVDFTPLSWTPSDAQMVEARQLSLVDVANLLNVDPYWVGASQVSAPYQNVQDAALQLSRFSLSPWVNPLEAQFSRFLPYGTEARFNRDTVLRDTASVRIANWVQLLNAGVVDEEYVRSQEGIPPDAAPAKTQPPAQLFPVSDVSLEATA